MVGKVLWRFSSAICFNSSVAFYIKKKTSTDYTTQKCHWNMDWTEEKNISKPIMVAGAAATWIKGECKLKMSCNCSCPANLSSVATESILIRSLFNPFIIWHELILFQGEGGPSLMTTLLYIFTVYVLKEVSLVKGSGHYTRSSATFFQIIITHECIQSMFCWKAAKIGPRMILQQPEKS